MYLVGFTLSLHICEMKSCSDGGFKDRRGSVRPVCFDDGRAVVRPYAVSVARSRK